MKNNFMSELKKFKDKYGDIFNNKTYQELKNNEQCDKLPMVNIDLETLKYVKFMFDIHSDFSQQCNGYRSLCDLIETMQFEANKT